MKISKKGLILIIIIIIVAIVAAYFTFFYTKKCEDINCFNSALSECEKTSIINDEEDATWFYEIKGKESGECKVYVELLRLKEGTIDIIKLEGKGMDCYLPLGEVSAPQSNLAKCHGLLREEMQEVVIKKLHVYITDNLGQIGEELNKAL